MTDLKRKNRELTIACFVLMAVLVRRKSDLSNSEYERLIDEWIHSEIERKALKRHLIDGIHIEPLSEEIDRSPRQTARILKKAQQNLFKHI